MKNDKRDGVGKFVFTDDGKIFTGQWVDDQITGMGKIIHPNGDVYEGQWLNNSAHGFGVYINNNGSKYEGTWADD